jgi:hypothetical protein
MKRLQVFNRHCYFSDVGASKEKPAWFSRERCFENLLKSADRSVTDLHFFYDEAAGGIEGHFLNGKANMIANCGTEASAFLSLLDFVKSFKFPDDTIIYIVEDDYLHRPGWPTILLEGIDELKADYISLFDHADKYSEALYYPPILSEVRVTKSSHWRTTPSTTNTYACRFGTLMKDMEIHKRFSTMGPITRDHDKFLELARMGRKLYTPIPGYSTHADEPWVSPVIDWSVI